MTWSDRVPAAASQYDRSARFEHQEANIDEASGPALDREWGRVVTHHFGGAMRDIDPGSRYRFASRAADRFKARIRSGRFGPLRYCRVWSEPACIWSCATNVDKRHHALALVVSGALHYESQNAEVQVRAGDFMIVRNLEQVLVEHDQPIEMLVLFNALPYEHIERFGPAALVRREGRSDAAAMLARWMQDACADRGLQSDTAAELMGRTVQALAVEVMNGEPLTAPRPRFDRQAIEQEVVRRIEDPELGLQELAETFHCSVRTLHRVFRREGEESLERYIQRQRVEACARRLRGETDGQSMSLTDLALQFGFSSSSHFSNAFRSRFGVSPSGYRKGLWHP